MTSGALSFTCYGHEGGQWYFYEVPKKKKKKRFTCVKLNLLINEYFWEIL